MKKLSMLILAVFIIGTLMPGFAMAAGDKASELVVVADTRVLSGPGYYTGFLKYMSDAYNANITVFAIWATVLTAVYGVFLGFFMDFIMSRTGLDLKSRKIIEH